MGFFRPISGRYLEKEISDTAFDDDFIKKTTRLPSAGTPYENPNFIHYFNKDRESDSRQDNEKQTFELGQPNRSKSLFSKIFKRRRKKSLDTNEKKQDTAHDSDRGDSTSIQSSKYEDSITMNKSSKSLFRHRKFHTSKTEATPKCRKSSTLGLSLRKLFPRRNKGTRPTPVKQDSYESQFKQSSSVYEVQETLTQRYMGNYDRLFKDMDEIPFDLTVEEPLLPHSVFLKAVHSISSSRKFKSSAEENTATAIINDVSTYEIEDWKDIMDENPYNFAKKRKQKDSLSITSSELELSSKYNIKLHCTKKSNRFGSFTRTLSRKMNNTHKKSKDIFSFRNLVQQEDPDNDFGTWSLRTSRSGASNILSHSKTCSSDSTAVNNVSDNKVMEAKDSKDFNDTENELSGTTKMSLSDAQADTSHLEDTLKASENSQHSINSSLETQQQNSAPASYVLADFPLINSINEKELTGNCQLLNNTASKVFLDMHTSPEYLITQHAELKTAAWFSQSQLKRSNTEALPIRRTRFSLSPSSITAGPSMQYYQEHIDTKLDPFTELHTFIKQNNIVSERF